MRKIRKGWGLLYSSDQVLKATHGPGCHYLGKKLVFGVILAGLDVTGLVDGRLDGDVLFVGRGSSCIHLSLPRNHYNDICQPARPLCHL